MIPVIRGRKKKKKKEREKGKKENKYIYIKKKKKKKIQIICENKSACLFTITNLWGFLECEIGLEAKSTLPPPPVHLLDTGEDQVGPVCMCYYTINNIDRPAEYSESNKWEEGWVGNWRKWGGGRGEEGEGGFTDG